MLSLRGKRCLITGGSRGIGLAIARLFASEGANCTLVGRHEKTLDAAVRSLKRVGMGDPTSLPLLHDSRAFDVSVADGWQSLMHHRKADAIDILVNAAGISQNSLLVRMPVNELDQILDVNLKGTILGCQAVIPKMMKQRGGCIINISSVLATHGGRGASVYAASKAAVIGLTRSLAWEVGRFNIRANAIQPGYIQTDMTKGIMSIRPFFLAPLLQNHIFEMFHFVYNAAVLIYKLDEAIDENADLATLIPLGRLGTVEEVAEAALFLANNSYAHNCVLNIDGGLSAT